MPSDVLFYTASLVNFIAHQFKILNLVTAGAKRPAKGILFYRKMKLPKINDKDLFPYLF